MFDANKKNTIVFLDMVFKTCHKKVMKMHKTSCFLNQSQPEHLHIIMLRIPKIMLKTDLLKIRSAHMRWLQQET